MDRRCLYGHRVNASFHYAIERDQCPVCGAELISLDGYRIARQLAQSVPMDGGMAFRTVKVIELSYVLQPRQPSPAVAPTSPEVPTGTEIVLEEEELVAAAIPAAPGRALADELEDEQSVELIAAESTDEAEEAEEAVALRTGSGRASAGKTGAGKSSSEPVVPASAVGADKPSAPAAAKAAGAKAARSEPRRGEAGFTLEEDAFFATSP